MRLSVSGFAVFISGVHRENILRCAIYVGLALSLNACGPEKVVLEATSPVVPEPLATDSAEPADLVAEQEVIRPVAPQPVVVALLLPLTGSDAPVGKALLNAAMLGYFDAYDPRIVLAPFDTKGTAEGARAAFAAAKARGATAMIGPLRGQNLRALPAPDANQPIPVLALSNDQSAASPHRYVLGVSPKDEIAAVVRYAAINGRSRFASLVPEGAYGDQVQRAYGQAILDNGVDWVAFERYPRIAEQVFAPMKRLTRYDARQRAVTDEIAYLRSLRDDMTAEIADQLETENNIPSVDFDVALVAEGSALLRTIAPLFPFYEVDKPDVQLIGTGLMNDDSLADELPLRGAWFAASPKAGYGAFVSAYTARYGAAPLRISALAYDAVALLSALARKDAKAEYLDGRILFAPQALTHPTGFTGVSGLFRLMPSGRNERQLAIFEIQANGLIEVEPAAQAFMLE